ncbi:Aspyridones efflux protein apdF [Lachnellula arida]|uniref:Aspyridones efflux protein apdF n=1 Tax=Lachnellula arida TaxID=1316785 RepID=A0A8T9BD77_9HELO|nr:Aspyridones efflux protein apdF [Lachnellula arida]
MAKSREIVEPQANNEAVSAGRGDDFANDPMTLPAQQDSSALKAALKPPESHVSSIPNGGLRAWLQVPGSFFLVFNTWGIVNSFGVFQTYYSLHLLSDHTPSQISWIGSTQAFLLLLLGVVTGPLFDAGYFYPLLWTGSFLCTFGMMMTSISTAYWHFILAQGICVGVGAGCLLIPSVALIPSYFTTKKAIAQGFAASGSSVGGIVFPIVFERLQPRIGFPWTVRVFGFIMVATLSLSLAIMRVRVPPGKLRKLLDFAAFRDISYVFFTAAMFFGFMGIYVPFFYLPLYCLTIPGFPTSLAFYIIAIVNASSTFGRILPNRLADKIGPLNVMVPCVAVATILVWCWIPDNGVGGVVTFGVLYGFFSGCFISLPPTALVTLSPSLDVIGARMGMVFTISGFGLLIGNPVAGAILNPDGGSFLGLQIWCGVTVTTSLLCLCVARIAKSGLSFTKII